MVGTLAFNNSVAVVCCTTPTPTPGGLSLQMYYKVGATGQETTSIIKPDFEAIN